MAGSGGTGYVVAADDLAPGTRLDPDDLRVAVADLAPGQAQRVFADPGALVGGITLAAIAEDELVQLAAVAPPSTRRADVVPGHEFSFTLPRARALGGHLRSGERVDLLATYGVDRNAYTTEVAQRALVLDVEADGGDLASPDTVLVTVGLDDGGAVLAVAHAAATDSLTVVRSTAGHVDDRSPSYQPPGPGPSDAGPSSTGPVPTLEAGP